MTTASRGFYYYFFSFTSFFGKAYSGLAKHVGM